MHPTLFCSRKSMRDRNGNRSRLNGNRQPSQSGVYVMETLIASVIGMTFLAAILAFASMLLRSATTNANQVLATNMAQELIDNARNSSYGKLLQLTANSGTVTENVPLYDYPSDPSTALFPRPLLRNSSTSSGMTYQSSTTNSHFAGTVTETLTNLTPSDSTNGLMDVLVTINWTDTTGPHKYSLETQISQNGVHI